MAAVYLYYFNINCPNEPISSYLELLSPQERERCGRLVTTELRQRFAVSHALMRLKLADLLNCQNKELIFSRETGGKPKLEAPASCSFNLSHSHQYGLLAVSLENGDNGLGVDIEYQEVQDPQAWRRRCLPISQRFFAKAENNLIEEAWESGDYLRAQSLFYQTWTAKEALLKAIGTGLRIGLNTFSLPPLTPGTMSQVKAPEQEANMYLYSLQGPKDYASSLCLPFIGQLIYIK